MWIDNRLRRLREVLCSTALAAAPFTSVIMGIPLIGHSLATALCPPTRRNDDFAAQHKRHFSNPEINRAHGTLPATWRNFFLSMGSDTRNNQE
jgi:hypothetical protein